ncbi:MAG: hypothetical protein OXS29_13605 [bacterium]|nr:hypothetical protein [bacterium]MDE0289562.1 hypothetical protein [bacterium]MDE0437718.1 hypothetical protein [bacterium]
MRALSYVSRRWATPAGRALILRWCRAVAVVAGYAMAVRVLWTRGLLPASLDDVTRPWRRIREFGAPDETLIPLALALGLLLGLPEVSKKVGALHRLRPWQPHTGGEYLASVRSPIPIPDDTWQPFAQQSLLDRAADTAWTPPSTPASAAPPSQLMQRPHGPESSAQPPSPSPTGSVTPSASVGQPPAGPTGLEQLAAAEALLGGPPPDEPPDGREEVRVFQLFGSPQKRMHPTRYNALAVIAYHAGRCRFAEVVAALGQNRNAVRAVLNRAVGSGWLVRGNNGTGEWRLAPGVVTDIDALHAAVANGDEAAAASVATGIGPPLVHATGPTSDWLDSGFYGPANMSVRQDLRAQADAALASAAERWPANRAFPIAVDQLYDE